MAAGAATPGFRVGWGFDAHRLNQSPPILLGGVVVSETQGVEATSDGDVLSHALIDALLGACALGDLGQHFPSDDPSLEGADSIFLLREAATMAVAAGYVVTHADVTVVAEDVRVAPHRDAIIASLAEALAMAPESVSVKATTTDGLGFIGQGEGIGAVAVVTVSSL